MRKGLRALFSFRLQVPYPFVERPRRGAVLLAAFPTTGAVRFAKPFVSPARRLAARCCLGTSEVWLSHSRGARFIAPWTAFVRLLLWLPRSTEPSQGQRFGIAALRRPLRRSAKVASDLGDRGNSPGMDRTSLPARYQVALGDVRLELGFRVQACHGQGARHRKRLHRSSRRRERVEGFREPGIRRLSERVSTGVGSWEKYPSTC